MCNSLNTAITNASDVDAVAALYKRNGISDPDNFTVDGSQTSVVSTSNNTITKNGHGLSNDELVNYDSGVDGNGDANDPIGGLVNGQNYYVIGKTVNTFKLSHTNSHMGDAVAISLTGVGEGSDHKFISKVSLQLDKVFQEQIIHNIEYRQSLINKYLQGDCYGCTVTGHCRSIQRT